MFDHHDFLTLALALGKRSSSGEAERRTSVGRAYYAAFLTAREWAVAQGLILTRQGEDHRNTRDKLIDNGENAAANKLLALSAKRGKADYDLAQTCELADCQQAITLANNIIEKLR